MRKAILSLCLLLIGILQAQVVELPEVEVTAESAIQAYLYKKAMRFGAEVPAYDSIPAFLPILRQVPRQAPILRRKAPLEFYTVSGLSTEGLIHSHLSYYSQDPYIKLISVNYNPAITNEHYKSHQLDLGVNLTIRDHYLLPELFHQYASAPGFKQSNLAAQIHHRTAFFALGNLSLTNSHTSLGFDSFSQKLALSNKKASYPFFGHSSLLAYRDQQLDFDILVQEGEAALELLYRLPQLRLPLEDLGLGLLTDFRGIAPAFSMSYRPIMKEREYLLVQGRSSILSQSWTERQSTYSHLARNTDERIAMELYSLKADFHKLLSGMRDLKSITLRAGNSYTVNSDQITFNG
ncbi:MAG: hypothetical protein V3576_07030, partial [Candidatus Cloacimonadota bacterium]